MNAPYPPSWFRFFFFSFQLRCVFLFYCCQWGISLCNRPANVWPWTFGWPVCHIPYRQPSLLSKHNGDISFMTVESEKVPPLFADLVMERENLWFMKLTLVQLLSWLSAPALMSSSVLHNLNIHSGRLCTGTLSHAPPFKKTTDLGHSVYWKKQNKKNAGVDISTGWRRSERLYVCSASKHTCTLEMWPQGDQHSSHPLLGGLTRDRGMETSQCGRHTCQQRSPAPSAALPNSGRRMSNRLPRGSRETEAGKKKVKEKKQIWDLAQSCIYNMSTKACISTF